MIRKLFATTALAGVLAASSAFAQDAQSSDQKMQQTPAATQSSGDAMQQTGDAAGQTAAANTNFLQKLSNDQYLASNLTGKSVYQSDAQDAESLGDIQNFLVGKDGKVVAAIVAADINDQSKTIAIPFEQIGWTMDQSNEPRAVFKGDVSALGSAPTFQTPEEQAQAQQNAAATTGAGATSSTGMAPAAGTNGMAASGTATTGDMAASNDAGATATTGDQQAMSSGAQTDGANSQMDNANGTQTASASNGDYPATVGSDQFLSENLIGTSVYGGPGEDADNVGDINDLVLASSGQVDAAVVGVGGFLGIGEKDVALPLDQLSVTRDQNNDLKIAASLTKDQLDQAPEFDNSRDANMASNGGATGNAMDDAGNNAQQAANNTGQALDNAADNTEQAASNAANATGNAMDNAVDQTQQAANDAGNALSNAGAAATGAAAGAGAAATNDMAQATATDDNTTTASTGGDNRMSQMTPVQDSEQLTADDLMGTTVYGPNDETVGDIGDIALNASGKVDAVIVDVGGFLGIGEKPVAVGLDNLNFMRDANGSLYLYTQFTEDQLKNAPEYNKDTYAENRNTMRLQEGAPQAGASQSGNTMDPAGTAEPQAGAAPAPAGGMNDNSAGTSTQ
ncbi:PRC-barrel domain-containing protein [Aurantimonas sp. VKM B-3413]|uniref:PRC-barrel domain-containing protein n=1 Tax=Aurantimonas sp. VKM B-3413 TaxID=2779401 RepID=UPI001E4ABE98|nr:PRC-barrel domain-containing protein [Aurantimonas sp. VKM B-3413]MCB8838111.1 PRC-barrel domain-containing protein [Aurantimonas sp. VKM B-3413]